VPARIIMSDAERDRRDASIAAELHYTHDTSKDCNEFRANSADDGYATPLTMPCVSAFEHSWPLPCQERR
jgi:hypothetical protein